MSHEGDGPAEVYRATERRARKPRRCKACGDTIAAGHRYIYVFTVYEGDTYETARCLRCEAIHAHLRDKCATEREGRWPSDDLDCGEDYRENWEEDPPPEIAALAFVTGADLQTTK